MPVRSRPAAPRQPRLPLWSRNRQALTRTL